MLQVVISFQTLEDSLDINSDNVCDKLICYLLIAKILSLQKRLQKIKVYTSCY